MICLFFVSELILLGLGAVIDLDIIKSHQALLTLGLVTFQIGTGDDLFNEGEDVGSCAF